MKLLISGYGGEGAPSIGKYLLEGEKIRALWTDAPAAPSYACQAGDLLFAGLERQGGGEILLYRRDGEGYALAARTETVGGELCHLSYSGGALYGACYETGHLFVSRIAGEAFVSPSNPRQEGEGESRAHFCAASPGGRFVYAVNIAQDRIYCYLPGESGLTENPAFPFLQLPKGEGPRHLCFHPSLPKAYLITEYSSRVFTLSIDRETGALRDKGALAAPPDGFSGTTYGSGIVISADGSRVYAGNRGANTVAVFAADKEGALTKLQDADCGGDWPRALSLSKDGKHLFVANQNSCGVALLPVLEDGRLAGATVRIPFSHPSFVEETD